MSYEYWKKQVAVLLDGLMLFGEFSEKGEYKTLELAASGTLLSAGNMLDVWEEYWEHCEVYCARACTVAILDPQLCAELFQTDLKFTKMVFQRYFSDANEKYLALKAMASRDTYEAVRYIVEWHIRKKMALSTHDVIALMCNLSRPTVTIRLNEMMKKEPELFRQFDGI